MSERHDLLMTRGYTDREGNPKTAYTKIGTAFALPDNGGFRLKFDAMPVPTIYDGKVELSILMLPPKDRAEQPAQSSSQASYGAHKGRTEGARASVPPSFDSGAGDDDIPFIMEWRG